MADYEKDQIISCRWLTLSYLPVLSPSSIFLCQYWKQMVLRTDSSLTSFQIDLFSQFLLLVEVPAHIHLIPSQTILSLNALNLVKNFLRQNPACNKYNIRQNRGCLKFRLINKYAFINLVCSSNLLHPFWKIGRN